ncbi:hypothetical protein EWM64_g8578 [Hericium alpestre]|uniref:WLM domain-containing protein n=1 Tax=Hericium alpestre TaxID=135208 RepID=A0A4Y9ZN61_9AGAM|nr:hypothetical protein EWM64_g8578 [Hericium alpestre]
MVHYRLNANETNPNPHVNFITALPMPDPAAQEQARQLLRALAAQLKPVMKAHGFVVNSFEEYEFNKVFAGRNWNHGETVELVVRNSYGGICAIPWLMSTLCHELAHIKHMHHGSEFQKLWRQLNNEVRALQLKGYYGDGYWSAGTRLADSARVEGEGVAGGDLPEFMVRPFICTCHCDMGRSVNHSVEGPRVEHVRRGAAATHRRRGSVPAQEAQSRFASDSGRVFKGEGRSLNAEIEDEEEKKAGTGFRKKASSKRAREERALAAERRVRALQGKAPSPEVTEDAGSEDEIDDGEEILETDQDRRRTMLESMGQSELGGLKSGTLADYWGDFVLPGAPRSPKKQASTGSRAPTSSKRQTTLGEPSTSHPGPFPSVARTSSPREDIGFDDNVDQAAASATRRALDDKSAASVEELGRSTEHQDSSGTWSCLVCTLENEPGHLACSACATPRGENGWRGS